MRCTALFALLLFLVINLSAQTTSTDTSQWKDVEAAMGRSGQMQPGDVIKFGMPRKDLHVVLDGVQIKPGLALGSWAAFKKVEGGAMVMGDLVLTEDELEPVMMKLQEEGIHESAVHNHLMGESPRILYMHIASHGNLDSVPGQPASAGSRDCHIVLVGWERSRSTQPGSSGDRRTHLAQFATRFSHQFDEKQCSP